MFNFLKRKNVYFKECPYCGSGVLYKEFNGKMIYACENFFKMDESGFPVCNTYVNVHAKTNGEAIKGTPKGRLANKDLRRLHQRVRLLFNQLWMKIDGYRKINEIEGYVVRLKNYEDNTFAYYNKQSMIATHIFTTKTEKVLLEDTETVTPRTKSYIWLAKKLGKSIDESKIPWMNTELAHKALEILIETLNK